MVLEKREWVIISIITFILGIIIGNYAFKSSNNNLINIEDQEPKIYVDIAGEVKFPGVYEMENGDRVFHLIEKAGGATENADISSINLSKKLTDGEKIIIFAKRNLVDSETTSSSTTQSNTSSSVNSPTKKSNLININTASQKELEELSGIGPVLAQRIIDYREKNGYFSTIEDIKKVSGIGDKRFEAIKDSITVGP
ncbi:MAG TPA: helix-hairpin-helix domain-containing protein [Caldisericia bacterium]|nr:helix-hairpin-helix domain-containing protein [Caldisericia bacterium]